ncbi:MAG: ADP-forming succinate--CoA ligase subunit beta [Candidatus Aminicenantes bacterium]|nr:ADP-forming succinate--CoA ligase subunit beta [Candidatus Aminicenantes bacterium]
MRLHEHQAKRLLAAFGIPVPRGEAVTSAADARRAASALGGPVVVKAQILSGGRGRAAGIRTAANADEAERSAGDLLGSRLVTAQTGPEGKSVRAVLIEEALPVARELYAGVAVDKKAPAVLVLASAAGGVEVETRAAAGAGIAREALSAEGGLLPHRVDRLIEALGLTDAASVRQASELLSNMAKAFVALDAGLIEINPLGLTAHGKLSALDAKVVIDDNALARHPELAVLRDVEDLSPAEREAERFGLNYIRLEGNIGCLVNGAGLAMATMDLIKLSGGAPANFLDIGGGVTEDAVAAAFRILVSDARVRAALINIFGGIVRCDLVARGVLKAVAERPARIPIVVRLEGTNAVEGRRLLAAAGLPLLSSSSLEEAAAEAVRSAGKAASP